MLTQIECDFIDFIVQKRGRPHGEVKRAFLDTSERFKFATDGYRSLCVTIHDLFSMVYGEMSERELVTSYQFHAALHLFRFLAYSHGSAQLKTMDFGQRAETLVGLIKGKPVVVDYGCGLGYISFEIGMFYPESAIYLVDIDCLILDFALYRFKKHHINAIAIPVTESVVYPELPTHNICIAEEVMEHLARPMIAYQNICNGLERGGVLTGNFCNHAREFFHVSPNLAELREGIAKDFESIRNNDYRRL